MNRPWKSPCPPFPLGGIANFVEVNEKKKFPQDFPRSSDPRTPIHTIHDDGRFSTVVERTSSTINVHDSAEETTRRAYFDKILHVYDI